MTTATPMALNETRTVAVDARQLWNASGILLAPGARYEIKLAQVLEAWKDKGVESDLATGWKGAMALLGGPASALARFRFKPMYALVGAQGRHDFFIAGRQCTLDATRAGELEFFANDWPWMYHNNEGRLALQVVRTR